MATQSVSLSAVLLKSLSLMISHCSLHFFLLLVPHAFKLSTVFYPALLKAVAKPVRQILFLTTPPPPTTSQPQNTQSAIFGLVVFLALYIIPYLWVLGSATNSALRGLQGLPAAVNSGMSWVLPLVFTRVLSLMQIASSSSLFRLLLDLMVPVIGPYFTAFLEP
ncbi:PREDICTED: LOC109947821 [Prunus dulcis]|uniref:PREDICTED: LOC109947821 n=1 Tax=Prunus dulcis TaxID=3755 RepID=A0A5E4FG40_PRUDU|nr:PREDICTED: LOC109947821 [Prunus dulcis]